MKRQLFASLFVVASLSGTTTLAQSSDVSPTLFIESLPSDNPKYRRMVRVNYLSGDYVKVSYVTYNRVEFIQVPTTGANVSECTKGPATKLTEINRFHIAEASLRKSGKAPKPTTFCIKRVFAWESKNKDKYLDPIFTGLPVLSLIHI